MSSSTVIVRACVQVIEKAYKKLRLDALVIQQGRLTQNASKVGKDDLLSMVKYGAEKVFSSEPTKITDEDIDAIITKGENETVRSGVHKHTKPLSQGQQHADSIYHETCFERLSCTPLYLIADRPSGACRVFEDLTEEEF
jgi:hypothetical protein